MSTVIEHGNTKNSLKEVLQDMFGQSWRSTQATHCKERCGSHFGSITWPMKFLLIINRWRCYEMREQLKEKWGSQCLLCGHNHKVNLLSSRFPWTLSRHLHDHPWRTGSVSEEVADWRILSKGSRTEIYMKCLDASVFMTSSESLRPSMGRNSKKFTANLH